MKKKKNHGDDDGDDDSFLLSASYTHTHTHTRPLPLSHMISYRAYDSDEGIEVAWNQVRLQGVKPEQKAKILGEITILEQLETDYIMRILNSWESSNGEYLIFITEIMSSGTLKE